MESTAKIMLESEFGFDTMTYSKNREILESMELVSENVRQLTGFTPEKVVVLNDGNNIYIEFANNLERLMEDAKYDLQEAVEAVMIENNIAACDINIIIDESSVDRINMEELIKYVGKEHVFRK